MCGDGSFFADKEVGLEIFRLVAAQVEHDIAREKRRIQLLDQVGGSHDKPCTAVSARPTHTIELNLDFAEGEE
eukprot:4187824-Pleurochrysis_carterae.AAC.1